MIEGLSAGHTKHRIARRLGQKFAPLIDFRFDPAGVYRPQTNGKAEAFNKTLQREWAYVRLYRSNSERNAAFSSFLKEYNGDRPHTSRRGFSPLARICQ
ncbi:MAG: transposase [Chloroflexi bacterium]|nr:transposase [Chloroflexota bacterium]